MPVTKEGPGLSPVAVQLLQEHDGDTELAARAWVRALISGDGDIAGQLVVAAVPVDDAVHAAVTLLDVTPGPNESRLRAYAEGFADALADEAERS